MTKLTVNSELQKAISDFAYGEDIGFGKTLAPVMVEMKYAKGAWSQMEMLPYGPLRIDPAAKVLHYAQEIFEGMKAYRNEKGEVYLFRPEMNAKRFNESAKRMAMPELPVEDFLESVTVFTKAMEEHVPTAFNRSLYLRPFMIATEPTLGVKASTEYSYYLIGCLVESYFSKPNVKVLVEEENCRAVPGGVGFAKTGANYGASLLAYNRTQHGGLDQTLWLDAIEKRYVEELSGMNFFAVIGDELVTPPLTDTILAGITRDSILKMANDFGLRPAERKIEIKELLQKIDSQECAEAFACGTASVLTPIHSLTYGGKTHTLKHEEGRKSLEIREYFLKLQRGLESDKFGWALKVN